MGDSSITDVNRGSYLDTYTISRAPYYRKLSVIILCIITAAYALVYVSTGDPQTSFGAAGGTLFFVLMTTAMFSTEYFRYPFKINAYAKGLEFEPLGFFCWDDVFLYKEKRNNMLMLKKGHLRNKEAKWPPFLKGSIAKFKEWGDTDDTPAEHLLFQINIPSMLTNIHYDDFLKLIDTKTKIHAPYDTVERTKS